MLSDLTISSQSKVFGALHAGHFKLLSTGSAALFADLIVHLDKTLFSFSVEPVRKKEAQAAVKEFCDLRSWTAMSDDDGGTTDLPHVAIYNRLVQCGWVIEMPDGLRTIVDMDGAARLLLSALQDIKTGRLRSFGGEVLQVKTLLESVSDNPREKSQNVRSAGNLARGFMGHLRAIASAMRSFEQQIKSRSQHDLILEAYFELFDSGELVADFRKLRSAHNPYRFRQELVTLADRLAADRTFLGSCAEGWVREGLATDELNVDDLVLLDLSDIVDVFTAVDRHLALIEATNIRIERRIANIARFIDRVGSDRTGSFMEAVRLLGKSAFKLNEELPVATPILEGTPPIDAASLYRARKKPQRTDPAIAMKPDPDPALLAYESAKHAYADFARVTPAKVHDYLDTVMAGRDICRGSDIDIQNLQEFFVFERLIAAGQIFGDLPVNYVIDRIPGARIQSSWIDCHDFEIRRIPKSTGVQHA